MALYGFFERIQCHQSGSNLFRWICIRILGKCSVARRRFLCSGDRPSMFFCFHRKGIQRWTLFAAFTRSPFPQVPFREIKGSSWKCFVVVVHGFLGCSFSVGPGRWLCRLRVEGFRWFCRVGCIRVLCFLGLAILWFRVQRYFLGLLVCSDRERGLCSGCKLVNRGGWLHPLNLTYSSPLLASAVLLEEEVVSDVFAYFDEAPGSTER